MVASVFMAGMPDCLCVSRHGVLTLIEFKVWRGKLPPKSRHEIEGLLKGPQIGVIKHKLWKRQAPCAMIVQPLNNFENVYYINDSVPAYEETLALSNIHVIAKHHANYDADYTITE
jgi:hypothetical protein